MDAAELKSLAVVVVASALSLLAVAAWHHFRGQRRLVEDLPTSKVAGVTLGLTELHGRADTEFPTVSPHGQRNCVFWRQEIFTEEGKSDGSTHWRKIDEKRGGRAHLDLVDDSGSIRVWARDAEIDMPLVYEGELYRAPTPASDGLDLVAIHAGAAAQQHKVREYAIDVGHDVLVIGTARLGEGTARPQITADPDGRHPFVITTKDETALTKTHSTASIIAGVVAVAAAGVFALAWVGGAALFVENGAGWTDAGWQAPVAAVFLVGWIMLFLALYRSYNGLVSLRNRAEKAWSLLDVEIARRHTLLPSFIEVVRAHHSHEIDVHHRVTAIRAGWVKDLPETPSDDAVADLDQPLELEARAVRDLIATAEAYSDLRANESFLQLQAELVVTEDRISLARHFYNDSVERLRNRREAFPDSFVAWMFDIDLDGEFTEYWDQRLPSHRTASTPSASTT